MLEVQRPIRPIRQIDVRVTHLARSMTFFAGVFDWRITRTGEQYAVIDTGMMPVLSLWAIGGSGMPRGVCPYVASVDCEADAARAVLLGGSVAVARSVVPGSGAWTDTLDPWGNELAFWQADAPGEPSLVGSCVNPVSWFEIGTPDLDAAVRYLEDLVGWQFIAEPSVVDYAACTACAPGIGLVGGTRGAAMGRSTVYITVDDVDAALARVRVRGGEVPAAPRGAPDGRTFALFDDPDRNRFAVVSRRRSG